MSFICGDPDCMGKFPLNTLRQRDACLIISKSKDKDVNGRDIIIDLSGYAWRRLCASCYNKSIECDKKLCRLTKSELISCNSSGFKTFCDTYPDICAKYGIGDGIDTWKIPSIFSNLTPPDFIHGKGRDFKLDGIFKSKNLLNYGSNTDEKIDDGNTINTNTNNNAATNTNNSKSNIGRHKSGVHEPGELRILFEFARKKGFDRIEQIGKFLKRMKYMEYLQQQGQAARKSYDAYSQMYVLSDHLDRL